MNQLIFDLTVSQHYWELSAVLAQVSYSTSASGEVSPFQILLSIAAYIFNSFCLQKIFDKLSVKDSWLAWVPIANLVKTFQVGDKNPWLLLLLFIPIIGVIAVLVLWVMAMMNIATKLNKPSWLGIAVIVPLLGIWAIYSMAF